MKFKKTISLLLAISLLAVLLVACADATPPGEPGNSGDPLANGADQTTAEQDPTTETPDTATSDDETTAAALPLTAEELLKTVRLALIEIKKTRNAQPLQITSIICAIPWRRQIMPGWFAKFVHIPDMIFTKRISPSLADIFPPFRS